MENTTGHVGAITVLLVAVTGLYVAISGGDAPPPVGITVVLDSPEAFRDFIQHHPANG